MKFALGFTLALFLVTVCYPSQAQTWGSLPSAPQPQPKVAPVSNHDYAGGFSFDNGLYAFQGSAVAFTVGTLSYRPWLGLASGVGSCALYRIVHIQGYHNDEFFGQNRMEFCAAGAMTSYGLMKLLHVRKAKVSQ